MTMIRNGITYDRLYRNNVQYAVGPVPPAAPAVPTGLRIKAEMKARSEFATIAHFRTRPEQSGVRYFQRPSNANKRGELIEEWVSGNADHVIFPLVRRLGINSAYILMLLQFTGSNVDLGGVNIGSRDWTALVQDAASTASGIYIVSVADSEYVCIPPLEYGDIAADRIDFTAGNVVAGGHQSAGWNTEGEVATWLVAERDTYEEAREFIIAVAADRTYIPTF